MFVSITTEQQWRHREHSEEFKTLWTTCPAFFPLNWPTPFLPDLWNLGLPTCSGGEFRRGMWSWLRHSRGYHGVQELQAPRKLPKSLLITSPTHTHKNRAPQSGAGAGSDFSPRLGRLQETKCREKHIFNSPSHFWYGAVALRTIQRSRELGHPNAEEIIFRDRMEITDVSSHLFFGQSKPTLKKVFSMGMCGFTGIYLFILSFLLFRRTLISVIFIFQTHTPALPEILQQKNKEHVAHLSICSFFP